MDAIPGIPQAIIFYATQGVLGFSLIVVSWKYTIDLKEKKEEIKGLQGRITEKDNKLEALADKRTQDITDLLKTSFTSLETIKQVDAEKSEQVKILVGEILSIVRNLQGIVQSKGGSNV